MTRETPRNMVLLALHQCVVATTNVSQNYGTALRPYYLEAILIGVLLGTWTAFETMADDLWEASLNKHPIDLAELTGKLPKTIQEPVSKKKPSALVSNNKSSADSPKQVSLDFLRDNKYQISEKMGTVLREKYNFQIFQDTRRAYTNAFAEHCPDVVTLIHDPSLAMLAEARHIFIHCGGIVDSKFMEKAVHCNKTKVYFPHAEGV